MTRTISCKMDDGSMHTAPAGHDELHRHPDAGSGNAPMSELVRLLGAREALRSKERSEPAVSAEQRRQMWHNVKGFFDTLAEWARREAEENENVAERRDSNAR